MGTEILFTKLKVHMIEYILHGVCHIVCPTVHKRLNIRSRFSQSRGSLNRGPTVYKLTLNELNDYMKLIFVKNLKNSKICTEIFNHLINNDYKKNSKSFIKEIGAIFNRLDINKFNLITDIQFTIDKFKDDNLYAEQSTEKELIINCLNNNHDYKMINQLILVTYSSQQYNATQ